MALKISKRGIIPPFIVMDVMRAANERASAGKDVLHLEVGQPSTFAPMAVIDAAKRALDHDFIGYTDALGVFPLRENLSVYYENYYGLSIPPERIIITILLTKIYYGFWASTQLMYKWAPKQIFR
jgi:aspartate/methionine/tyrosine aminotransferase